MSKEFFSKLHELTSKDETFAIATVINIEGSASAKPGSKAIIDSNGKMILGWVGGGCAESTVRQEALDSFKDNKTRVVALDLDDEILGIGMPCGGMMDIYVEPREMSKEFTSKLQQISVQEEVFAVATVIKTEGSTAVKLGSKAIIDINGNLILSGEGWEKIENLIIKEALISIKDHQTRIVPLDLNTNNMGKIEVFIEPYLPKPELMIFGHGKIVETLAKLGYLMNFSVTIKSSLATKEVFPMADRIITQASLEDMDIGSNSYIIVATQHKGDHFTLKKALESKAPYIALIASKKRTELTFEYVLETGISAKDLERVRAPAGLDLGGPEPEEIALSIISEIVATRHNGSSKPLMEVKGARIPNVTAISN